MPQLALWGYADLRQLLSRWKSEQPCVGLPGLWRGWGYSGGDRRRLPGQIHPLFHPSPWNAPSLPFPCPCAAQCYARLCWRHICNTIWHVCNTFYWCCDCCAGPVPSLDCALWFTVELWIPQTTEKSSVVASQCYWKILVSPTNISSFPNGEKFTWSLKDMIESVIPLYVLLWGLRILPFYKSKVKLSSQPVSHRPFPLCWVVIFILLRNSPDAESVQISLNPGK